MAQNKALDRKIMFQHFDRLERIGRQREMNIIASGRFTYLGIEGDYKLYKEHDTGYIAKILVPKTFSVPAS